MSNIDIFAESRLEISRRISRRSVSLEKLLPNLRDFRVMGLQEEGERERIVPFSNAPQARSRCRLVINVGVSKSSNVNQVSHPRFRANIVIIGFAGDACNVI